MYPVSDAFKAALRKSHTTIARCDLYQQGVLVQADLPMLGASITDDSQAIVRRRASLALPAMSDILDLLPASYPIGGGLWPLGNELKLWAGLRLATGDELVPMGVFRISKPQMADASGQGTVTVDGYDRARAVSRARFTAPYVVAQGTNYVTAIKNLIQSRLPWLGESDFLFMETNYVTPLLTFLPDDDPMDMAIRMADSLGAELFFDGDGRCVLRQEPNPIYTPSCFSYVEGEDAIITGINRTLDDEQAYNGVIVVGEGSQLETPVRAEAWDTDQNSPTYYDPDHPEDSVYGAVPYFITSQYITEEAQAQDAADANLTRVSGIVEQIQFDAVNNPAHQSGDVITVGRERISAAGTHVLDSFQCTIGNTVSLSGVTRKRRAA